MVEFEEIINIVKKGMIKTFNLHNDTKGDSYKDMTIEELRGCLKQEIGEWKNSIGKDNELDELFDVANSVAMLVWKFGQSGR